MNHSVWDAWAEFYRQQDESMDYAPSVQFIRTLISAESARVADMGCGAGGFVRALVAGGFDAVGVDSSEEMIQAARSFAAEGEANRWYCDDMTVVELGFEPQVITCMHSTICSLVTAQAQIDFFRNCAQQLPEGGLFVCEAYVPGQDFLFPAKSVEVMDVSPSATTLLVSKVNRATQRADMQQVEIGEAGIGQKYLTQRFVWPSEMDLYAALAGLTKVAQYSDYQRSPLSNSSRRHIGIYRNGG